MVWPPLLVAAVQAEPGLNVETPGTGALTFVCCVEAGPLEAMTVQFSAWEPFAWNNFFNKPHALVLAEQEAETPCLAWLDSDILILAMPCGRPCGRACWRCCKQPIRRSTPGCSPWGPPEQSPARLGEMLSQDTAAVAVISAAALSPNL